MKKRWYAADFSWNGLAHHRTPDGVSLQKFFANEADKLLPGPDGRNYTRFHFPLWDEGLKRTDKLSWPPEHVAQMHDDLASIAEQALAKGLYLPYAGLMIPGILPMPKSKIPPSLDLNHALVVRLALDGEIGHIHAPYSLFSKPVHWNNRIFGNMNLFKACFISSVSFGSMVAHGNSDFSGAKFCDSLFMEDAEFIGEVSFFDCEIKLFFADRAEFRETVSMTDATVRKDFLMVSCKFMDRANFWGLKVGGEAEFTRSVFQRPVTFRSAQFDGSADFSFVSWPDSPKQRAGVFENATFKANAYFRDKKFDAFSLFAGSAIEREIVFHEGTLTRKKAFKSALRRATDREARLKDFYEEQKAAREYDAANEDREADQAEPASQNLSVSFESPGGHWPTDAASLRAVRLYRETSRGQSDQRKVKPPKEWESFYREQRLRDLQEGIRILRNAKERSGDKLAEQGLHRMEMLIRRHRPGHRQLFTFLGSRLYGLLSDFGGSMGHAFFSIIGLWLLGALFFATSFDVLAEAPASPAQNAEERPASEATTASPAPGRLKPAAQLEADVGLSHAAENLDMLPACRSFAEGSGAAVVGALAFSMRNIVRPFSAWSPIHLARDCFALKLIMDTGPATSIGIRLAATAQSIFAILLIFLFGLAARRKFQIN